jgi:hypothetical protein
LTDSGFEGTRSSSSDEGTFSDGRRSGGGLDDLRRRNHRNDLTIAGGLYAAVAVGAGAARLAKAAVARPATATAVGMLRLGWHFEPGVSGHPLLVTLTTRGELVKNRLEHEAADALRALLRRAVNASLDRLDLAGIASQVIDAIDLPGILRQSTGAVSSQAARVVRTEGMHADESVSRFMDRVLRRPHPQGAVGT